MHIGSKKLASFGTELTHWGLVMHICNSKLTIIGSDNGLSPGQCQAIIWTNAGILLIGPLGTNLNEILIKIYEFSLKKMHLNMLCAKKWWPSCVGLNVLYEYNISTCKLQILITYWDNYTPTSTKLKGGYTGFTLSVCPSVGRIVSALYFQQHSSDPFHICTSYQATSEGVSCVMFVWKLKNLKFRRIF